MATAIQVHTSLSEFEIRLMAWVQNAVNMIVTSVSELRMMVAFGSSDHAALSAQKHMKTMNGRSQIKTRVMEFRFCFAMTISKSVSPAPSPAPLMIAVDPDEASPSAVSGMLPAKTQNKAAASIHLVRVSRAAARTG
jgi:hypothetical protein